MTYEEICDFCIENHIFIDTREAADLKEFHNILRRLKPDVELKYVLDEYRARCPYAHPTDDGLWCLWSITKGNLWSVGQFQAELQDVEAREEDIQSLSLEDVL